MQHHCGSGVLAHHIHVKIEHLSMIPSQTFQWNGLNMTLLKIFIHDVSKAVEFSLPT